MTTDEVRTFMSRINKNKSSLQNLKIEHFLCIPTVYIKHLYNTCLCYGHIPKTLASAQVKPLLKDSLKSRKLPSNYRPISLVMSLSKPLELIYESHILRQSCDKQYAYKAGQSCLTCYADFRKTVLNYRKEFGSCYVAYIDLSRAFDGLPFQQVLNVFTEDKNTPNYICRSVQNFLTQGELILTPNLKVKPRKGVKQGGLISPKLFTLVCDEFLRTTRTLTTVYGYADDFVVISPCAARIQMALDDFESFCNKTGLTPNPGKTKIQLFSKIDMKILPIFSICGKKLEYIKIFKYLGYQTDTIFSDDCHMLHILSKFRKAVMRYKKTLFTTNKTLLLKLLDTYLIPKLYGMEFFDPSISVRYQTRYEYLLSIAANVKTSEIDKFLSENPRFELRNLILSANSRKPN